MITTWQTKTFTKIFLNIMSNFIPHETIRITSRDSPWITKTLNTMLNRKNRLFKNFKRHGYQETDKIRIDNFRMECQDAVETAKQPYISNLGNKLTNLKTSEKSYWTILNKVMNRCKVRKIPPLLVNNKFILNCREKATLFTQFLSRHCSLVLNNSILPILSYFTNERLSNI